MLFYTRASKLRSHALTQPHQCLCLPDHVLTHRLFFENVCSGRFFAQAPRPMQHKLAPHVLGRTWPAQQARSGVHKRELHGGGGGRAQRVHRTRPFAASALRVRVLRQRQLSALADTWFA